MGDPARQAQVAAAAVAPASAPVAAAVRIADPEAALFAADMHLHESDPLLARRFFEMLQEALDRVLVRAEPPVLFLLGDLFEYWVGDDHVPDVALEMADRLAALAREGGKIFLMHGNRDFLMDVPIPALPAVPTFSARCGGVLLPDPSVIEVAGRRVGISHGDALCTDDASYQQWRRLCRSASWQQQFLGRPVQERLAMAQALRKQSLQTQAATETTHDVNPAAVDELMTSLDVDLLIHGHTHLPMLHDWQGPHLPGSAHGSRMRWVLSDWGLRPPRGSVLSLGAAVPSGARRPVPSP